MNFTLEDYIKLPSGKRLLVDEWVAKYGLSNQVSLIVQVDDESPVLLEAYGQPGRVEVFTEPGAPPVLTFEAGNLDLVIVAKFHFDDFPWHILSEEISQEEARQYKEHSILLNKIAWKIADELELIPEGATEIEGDIEYHVNELIAARHNLQRKLNDYRGIES